MVLHSIQRIHCTTLMPSLHIIGDTFQCEDIPNPVVLNGLSEELALTLE